MNEYHDPIVSYVWYIMNYGFLAVFFAAMIYNLPILMYIVLGFAWVSAALSFILLNNAALSDMIKKEKIKRAVPYWVSISTDLIIAFSFLSYGFLVLTFFWLMQAMIQERAFLIASKIRESL